MTVVAFKPFLQRYADLETYAGARVVRRLVFLLAIGLAGALAFAWPAVARSLTDAERAALAETVADFTGAMRESRFERVIATVPPKIMDHIAKSTGIAKDHIVVAMMDAMKAGFGDVKIEAFSMDMGKATFAEAAGGKPYALIPTRTVIASPGGRLDQASQTLGLLDEGKWYLVRIANEQQVAILRVVYPEFADIEIPRE